MPTSFFSFEHSAARAGWHWHRPGNLALHVAIDEQHGLIRGVVRVVNFSRPPWVELIGERLLYEQALRRISLKSIEAAALHWVGVASKLLHSFRPYESTGTADPPDPRHGDK